MKKFLTYFFLLISSCVFTYSLYMEGYLDQTPLYDAIYTVSHIAEEKISSPVYEGDMLSFYPEENVSVKCDGSSVVVSGISHDAGKSNLIIRIEDNSTEVEKTAVRLSKNDTFTAHIRLPAATVSDMPELSVFVNSEASGTFTSWVNDYVFFERVNGEWRIAEPIVYAHNESMYTKPKASGASTKATRNIQAKNASIKAAAERVTGECATDYEKAAAIHDYICDNFYYDRDMAKRETIGIASAAEIMASKLGVCAGFANAYAAMCRSVGIPCVVVTGYALGMDISDTVWDGQTALVEKPNHAWNEVYADGRWIIVDTTWDCGNSYESGHIKEETGTSHLYFDANLKYFSVNHKILRYKDI